MSLIYGVQTARNPLREIAQLLAFRHLNSDPVDPVAIFHRDDGDNEFMNILATQLQGKVCPLVGVKKQGTLVILLFF